LFSYCLKVHKFIIFFFLALRRDMTFPSHGGRGGAGGPDGGALQPPTNPDKKKRPQARPLCVAIIAAGKGF
jgi:hypothetical protein